MSLSNPFSSIRVWLFAAALVAPIGCQPREGSRKIPTSVATLQHSITTPEGSTGARSGDGQVVWFDGTCDASGAIPLDAHRFAVADDEDNVIRIYDADRGGRPLEEFDLSTALSLEERREADIEAATRIGGEAYFLSSHSRTRDGELDLNRLTFFGTNVPDLAGQRLDVIGAPYRSLVRDLLHAPSLARFDLEGSFARGELELEGMTAMPGAGVLMGLRSPVPEGQALVLRLSNPAEVVRGEPARFEGSESLDLGGLGIRGLSWWRGGYLVIAGPAGDGGPFGLYRWHGTGAPTLLESARLSGFGPEGFFSHHERSEVLVLSDDGTRLVDGVLCKRLDGPDQKRFRGVWLGLPPVDAALAIADPRK